MQLERQFTIQVNGESKDVAAGLTVVGLLERMGLNAGRVAVERNRSILSRDKWGETLVAAGDQFEIVQFVGGG